MGLELTRAQIAESYMVLGGIPHYWHYMQRGLSVAQNIDDMFFAGDDKLENEFDELYSSLFSSPQAYVRIITVLGTKKSGMTNLCEMKYHDGRYPITKEDDDSMRNKKAEFKEETGTSKAVHVTYITPYGVKDNAYARNVQSCVVLDDLFAF